MLELEQALPRQVDLAYYLVHSMSPTAHLDQGSFADYDLILADNFARVIRDRTLQQVVYLSGLQPPEGEPLSPHLESRKEVESIFLNHKLPTTIFRAGLIVGWNGSSFEILMKLVRRLPLMLCPRWTQTLTAPTSLNLVTEALTDSATSSQHLGQTYDLAGCPVLTYQQMMEETSRWLGKKRIFLAVPFLSPKLSRLWVSLITGVPRALVSPLVESLQHPMCPRPQALWRTPAFSSYQEMLQQIGSSRREKSQAAPFVPKRMRVRSVQRLRLPPGMTAEDVANEYMRWLPRFMRPWIRVDSENDMINFSLLTKQLRLLVLKRSQERSRPDRQLLYIVGGLLAGENPKARLEFRETLNGQALLVAIHDYQPALPWFIYQWTQAKIHLAVMHFFGKHLRSKTARSSEALLPLVPDKHLLEKN